MPKPKKIIIRKEDTDTTEPSSDSDNTSSSFEKDSDYTSTLEFIRKKRERYLTLGEGDYTAPRDGSKQDNLTSEEILQRLKNYVPLKSMDEKRVLKMLKPFKTWIKYINIKTGKFRTGGLLTKVVYPNYIMLLNSTLNITWSVQLKDNIIFVKHPKIIEQESQVEEIKDELYELYKRGELKRV